MIEDLAKLDGPPSILSLPGKAKNIARLAEWPSIDDVRLSSATQQQFDSLAALIDPVSLMLDCVRADDFSALPRMSRLRNLVIDSNARLADLDFLTPLQELESLELRAIKQPLDLTPLAQLTGLRRLVIDGGFSRVMKAKSVAPLAALKQVTTLQLVAVRFEDQSLAPLAEMTALTDLQITNFFPVEAYAELHALRPDIKSDRLAPYSQSRAKHFTIGEGGQLIEEEGGEYMVTGKRKPFFKKSEADRLQRYVDDWNKLVAHYRKRA